MIGRLRGILLEVDTHGIVVDVGGVGYAVSVPLSSLPAGTGHEINLFIHTEVREDAIQLFGFTTREEREAFRKLTTVQGIGPGTALAILSGLPLAELVTTIQRGDVKRLSTIPRVGRKTAERICLELRDKLSTTLSGVPAADGTPRRSAPANTLFEDALAALENLGYKSQSARSALERVRAESPEAPLELWLRRALQYLSP